MKNIFDYLDKYGSYSFKEERFNNIDSLVLCKLSYFPLDEIGNLSNIGNVFKIFNYLTVDKEQYLDICIRKEDRLFLKKIVSSMRYKNIKIGNYVNIIDEKLEKQFGALCFFLDEFTYVAFKGTTDDIVGWKEDFNMGFEFPIPSQIEAVNYLNKIGKNSDVIFIGGHSKGGNLAIYSGVYAKYFIKDKIQKIYNFDGPGFDSSLFLSYEYQMIYDKIDTFIPKSSIVGLLLDYRDEYKIIDSSGVFIFQHDIYTWIINEKDFSYLDNTSQYSKIFTNKIRKILMRMSKEDRKEFIDSLYSLIEISGIKKINDFNMDKFNDLEISNIKVRRILFLFCVNVLKYSKII